MGDRELLVLAAKAAGIDFDGNMQRTRYSTNIWDPLHDDAEAFRLAHKLGIQIKWFGNIETVRHAIVRAAAEIGRNTP